MKKLLYVANPFPPTATGGNARHLRFLRYLPESGWEATVLSVRTQGPVPDPPGVRIVRAAALDPERLYALGRRLMGPAPRRRPAAGAAATATGAATSPRYTSRRAPIDDWLQVPDAYVSWIVPAVRRGRRLLREERFDALFSSYPRGSAHLVAAELARESGLPWVADYRDPWLANEFHHYPTRCHQALNVRLESWALSQAGALTAVDEPIAEGLRRRYPALAAATSVISNGYDADEDIDEVELGPGFWLVHTGRLYGRTEQLAEFLTAFAALPDDVHVLFLGVGGPEIAARAAALGVAHRVQVEPFAPRARARGLQRAADALLLITGRAPETLTSKLFEYLASGRPIFAVTPLHSAACHLIDEAAGGRCAAPDEPLSPALATFVADARAGRLPPARADVVRRYDGRELTQQLAAVLDGLTGDHG
jgi:glycosyltransferase involved in cell wall biosynthesis